MGSTSESGVNRNRAAHAAFASSDKRGSRASPYNDPMMTRATSGRPWCRNLSLKNVTSILSVAEIFAKRVCHTLRVSFPKGARRFANRVKASLQAAGMRE
jgi:hypothetical protein